MNVRLLILIAVAAGLAVYFATVKSRPTAVSGPTDDAPGEPQDPGLEDRKRTLDTFDLPGTEPTDPADLSVRAEVDRSQGKNRLYFTISERHGYYVEQFRVHAWYKGEGVTGPENSRLVVPFFFDRFLKADETLRVCGEAVPAELSHVDGDIGTTANWDAEIVTHGRVRAANPTPLPPITDLGRCD